ncbi:hypothetical protein AB0M39_39315 [Streptomyces sp. NPDC051907]|uniref:hypothetical protein n=1 Tax=Streptomyces sp. NPDC051907 TaxID=3155284 RepID=UPI003447C17B
MPLWPEHAPPPQPSAGAPSPTYQRYLPVDEVSVPAGGLKDVPVKELLQKDPNAPKLVLAVLEGCPGAQCGLRKPVYRDLSGDGRDELIVAVDEPKAELTLIQVYSAFGATVRPVLMSIGRLGLTGETFGYELVLSSTGEDGQFTTRYRWNGAELTRIRDEEPAPSTPPDGPTPVPTPSMQPPTSTRTPE